MAENVRLREAEPSNTSRVFSQIAKSADLPATPPLSSPGYYDYHPGLGLRPRLWRCSRPGSCHRARILNKRIGPDFLEPGLDVDVRARGWRAAAGCPGRGRRMPGGGVGIRRGGTLRPAPRNARQRGRRMPAVAPIAHALPSGNATNLVPWLDFTRNSTMCFPALRASLRLLRTSAGVDTGLPPTSRITSPT
jgi:hypothetical protein